MVGASSRSTFAVLIVHMLVLMFAQVNVIFTSAAEVKTNDELDSYFFACSGGNLDKFIEMVDDDPTLVHRTTKDGEHCLHLCALEGNAEMAKILLEKGADPNIRSAWDQGLRMHPLSWSTFYGRYEIIDLLLKHGANVNADFDLSRKEGDKPAAVGTVLDVVEQILLNSDPDDEDKKRFVETRNILVKAGALRYASLEQEQEL